MWQWFFAISGGVCFGLFLFVALAYLWFRMKFRKLGKTIQDALGELATMGDSLPHFRITLETPDDFAWHHPDKVEPVIETITSRGFADVGRFRMKENANILLQGFIHEPEKAFAVVYDMADEKKAGIIDVVCDYEDGTHLTYCNNPDEGIRKPDFCPVVRMPDASAMEILDRFLRERKQEGVVPCTASDFKDRIEQSYAREMNWRVDRGGFAMEEVHAAAAADGRIAGEDALELTQNILNGALSGGVDDVLRDGFLEQSDMSAAEWEDIRDRLAFVHGMTEAEALAGRLMLADDDEEDEDVYDTLVEEVKVMIDEHGAIDAFRVLIDQRGKGNDIVRRATITDPVKADVYIMPEQD